MRNKKTSLGMAVVLAMFAIATLTSATHAAAQTEKVLYAFGTNPADGFTLDGSLVSDSKEFRRGSVVKGQLLSQWPKRADIWGQTRNSTHCPISSDSASLSQHTR
jgi:hypothetical protein